jgi:hypothetical protein
MLSIWSRLKENRINFWIGWIISKKEEGIVHSDECIVISSNKTHLCTMTLTDQMGRIVLREENLHTNKIEIIANLSSGLYTLTIFLENGTLLQTKVSIL